MVQEEQWARVLNAAAGPVEFVPERERLELLDAALGLGPTITERSVGCSITQATGTGYTTPAASTSLALELDLAQYVHAEGPCVSACRDGRAYNIVLMTDEPAFPLFTAAAARLGVRSSLSLPLPNRQATALNLYADSADAFGSEHAAATASLLARCVAAFLPDNVSERSTDQDELRRALESRTIVQRAQQLVAEREHVDAAEAFERMIAMSSRRNVSMFEVAARVVAEAADDL